MRPRYSTHYLDRLFRSDAYADLVQVSSLLCATGRFSPSDSDYGLPEPLFVFVETLTWFAQSSRSGAWTYHEAVPASRQADMLRALQGVADPALAERYAEGIKSWRDPNAIRVVDDWIESHHDDVMAWLRGLIRANRATIEALVSD